MFCIHYTNRTHVRAVLKAVIINSFFYVSKYLLNIHSSFKIFFYKVLYDGNLTSRSHCNCTQQYTSCHIGPAQ